MQIDLICVFRLKFFGTVMNGISKIILGRPVLCTVGIRVSRKADLYRHIIKKPVTRVNLLCMTYQRYDTSP